MDFTISALNLDWTDHRQGVAVESYEGQILTFHFFQKCEQGSTGVIVVGETLALEEWYLNVYGGHPDDLGEIIETL